MVCCFFLKLIWKKWLWGCWVLLLWTLGFISHGARCLGAFLSWCQIAKFSFGLPGGRVRKAGVNRPALPPGFWCPKITRQRLPTWHRVVSARSRLNWNFSSVFSVTFSGWAAHDLVSGPLATSLQMGTSFRQSPTTNPFFKHWSMASGKACK